MSDASAPVRLGNGWTLYGHPAFLDQIDAMIAGVDAARRKDPEGFRRKNAAKRLAAVERLVLHDIPADPARPEYRHGGTLGSDYRHWFRAKFFQQYRVFFRYHEASRIIVYGWVNDEDTKRAYESDADAYRVFRKMLQRGRPPDDWDQLLAEAVAERERFARIGSTAAP